MKAKELRIGNLVKYSLSNIPQEIKSIISVHGDYIVNFQNSEFSNTIDKIKPIPLTEEWLLKFGFIKLDNNKYGIGTYNNEYWIEFVMDRVFFFIAAYMDSPPSVGVKYVHQLQNLYFSLTGEELAQVSEGENKNFV